MSAEGIDVVMPAVGNDEAYTVRMFYDEDSTEWWSADGEHRLHHHSELNRFVVAEGHSEYRHNTLATANPARNSVFSFRTATLFALLGLALLAQSPTEAEDSDFAVYCPPEEHLLNGAHQFEAVANTTAVAECSQESFDLHLHTADLTLSRANSTLTDDIREAERVLEAEEALVGKNKTKKNIKDLTLVQAKAEITRLHVLAHEKAKERRKEIEALTKQLDLVKAENKELKQRVSAEVIVCVCVRSVVVPNCACVADTVVWQSPCASQQGVLRGPQREVFFRGL